MADARPESTDPTMRADIPAEHRVVPWEHREPGMVETWDGERRGWAHPVAAVDIAALAAELENARITVVEDKRVMDLLAEENTRLREAAAAYEQQYREAVDLRVVALTERDTARRELADLRADAKALAVLTVTTEQAASIVQAVLVRTILTDEDARTAVRVTLAALGVTVTEEADRG